MRSTPSALESFQEGKFKATRSWALASTFSGTLWGHRSLDGELGAQFNFRRIDYQNRALVAVAPLDQELGLVTGFRLGRDERTNDPWLDVGTQAFAGMRYVGEERAFDSLRGILRLGSPRLLNLAVEGEKKLMIDPLPLRDDIFDPELEELAGADDRGHRVSAISIGLEPYHEPSHVWNLSLRREKADYISAPVKILDHQRLKFQTHGHISFAKQTYLDLKLEYTKRLFSRDEPKRDDAIRGISILFGIKDVLALNHQITLAHWTREGSAGLHDFRRQVYEYLVTLEF